MNEVEKSPEEIAAEAAAAQLKADEAAKLKEAEKVEKARLAQEKKDAKAAEKQQKADEKAAQKQAEKDAKAKAEADKKAERTAAKLEQNGVSRPLTGATKQVWDIADSISAATKKPAERKDVVEAGKAAGLQEGTINTQYGRWRRFHGLTVAREVKPVAPVVPAAPEVPAAPVAEIPPAVEGVDVPVAPQTDTPAE